MECRQCVVFNKRQWERIKQQAGYIGKSKKEIQSEEKKKYLDKLNERSRAWMKTWPDTEEGIVILHEERKKKEHEKNWEFIKAYEEQKRNSATKENTGALKEAKQKIFNTTCHGVQLISAFRESKVIEEREAQIEFSKFMKQKAKEQNKELEDKIASMNNLYDFNKRDEEKTLKSKELAEETKNYNKILSEINALKIRKEKEETIQAELEDAKYAKQMMDLEDKQKDQCKEHQEKALADYYADRKAVEERRLRRQIKEDELNLAYNKHQDKIRSKEKQVWNKIIKSRFESDRHKKLYDNIQQILKEDQEKYDKFINVGIERAEERRVHEEEKQKKQEAESKKKELYKASHFKEAIEVKEIMKHANKCHGIRSSLFTKPHKRIIKDVIGGHLADSGKPRDSFREPSRKLLEGLKQREKQSSGWTGLDNAHRYFAEQAGATLKECKHKGFVRKVVDDYRKSHHLDSKTLPVANY